MFAGIIPNADKININSAVSAVVDKLNSLGIKNAVCENNHFEKCVSFDTCSESEIYKSCDVIIAVGGDGTIIHTCKKAAMYNKPVLGVNSGRIGYMAGLEVDELDMLSKLVTGDYSVEKRMMIKATVSSDTNDVHYCLNDIVISKGALDYAVDISLCSNGHSFMSFRADGIIAATPTGSTAYAMSAGGPVTDPAIECMILVPICPITLYSRGIVISADSKIEAHIKTRNGNPTFINFDGEDGIKLTNEDTVTFTKANDIVTRLIRIKHDSFCDVLRNKISSI